MSATVDARGAATQVVVRLRPDDRVRLDRRRCPPRPALGGVSVPATLVGLAAGTTYHVRVRATNEEGTATGADTTFATAAGPPTAARGVDGAGGLRLALLRIARRR